MQTTRAAAVLSPEKKRGRAGLTVPHQTLESVSRNGGARAELGGERIGELCTRWGRTVEAELGLQWRRRRSARTEREREGERGRASGRNWQRGRRRALLVADQGASRLPHARHAAAELCQLVTAARRGRERGERGVSAGGLGWLRPAGQK